MEGVDKVLMAMEAQQARLDAEAKAKNAKGPSERIREVVDMSKTRDWLTTDAVFQAGPTLPQVYYQSRGTTSSKSNLAKGLTIGERGRNITSRSSTSCWLTE